MFNPAQLTLARTRRGLSKSALATATGISSRSIQAYERGAQQPSPATASLLAETLRFPPEFFFAQSAPDIAEGSASFRSLSRMTASQRYMALGAGRLALLFAEWIEHRFSLPKPDVPMLDTGEDPETAAESVRRQWGLGEQPVGNTVHLLEAHGVRVFSLAEQCREVDAFSLWSHGRPFAFLNTMKSAERSRMDAAHELGHLVMHAAEGTPQGKEQEGQAKAFASAFLMPRASVLAYAPTFPSLGHIVQLKRVWGVATSALVYRLHTLGLISDWHYRSLNIQLSERGYRTAEPHSLERETSQVLTKVLSHLRDRGESLTSIAQELMVHPEDLSQLVFGLTMLPVDGHGDRTTSTRSTASLRVIYGTGETGMAAKPNRRDVTPNPKGGWDVRQPGAARASAHTKTQKEAVDRGRQILRNAGGGELRVKGTGGQVRAQDTVPKGNDPKQSKG